MALSVQEFAAKIKQKYPEYQNVDDNTLTQKIIGKYPEYKTQVDFGSSSNSLPNDQSNPTALKPPKSPDMISTIGNAADSVVDFLRPKSFVEALGTEQRNKFIADPNTPADMTQKAIQVNEDVASGKNKWTAAGAANLVTEGAIKPIAKFGASTLVTGAKDIGAATYGAAKGIYGAATGQNNEYYNKVNQEAQGIGTDSFPVPWLGNLNYNRKDQKGNYDPQVSLGQEAAGGGAALIGAANLVNPSQSILSAGLRGGALAGLNEIQNEGADSTSVGTSALIGGASGAVLQGVFNKLFTGSFKGGDATLNKAKNSVIKISQETGITPDKVKTIINMDPEKQQIQKQFLEQAWKNVEDPDTIASPMEDLANKVTSGMRKLQKIKQDTGEGIGNVRGAVVTGQEIGTPVDVTGARKTLLTKLAQEGVTVNNAGNLNFKKSSLVDLGGDQKLLSNLWNSIKKKDNISEKEAIILRKRLQNALYDGKVNKTITVAENFTGDVERHLTDTIHQNKPELKELDSIFSQLTKAVHGFQKKTSGTVQLTADSPIDGTNTYNLLRRSLGGGNLENKNIVMKLSKIGEKYGIEELKDLPNLRRMAQMAEDIVQTDLKTKPTSFTSRAAAGGKGILDILNLRLPKAADNIMNAVKSEPTQQDLLMKLLNKPQTPKILKQIIQTRAGQVAKQHLQASLPQLFAGESAKDGIPQVVAKLIVEGLKSGIGMFGN